MEVFLSKSDSISCDTWRNCANTISVWPLSIFISGSISFKNPGKLCVLVNDVVWLGGRMALSGGGWDWVLESPNEDIRYTNFLVRCEDHLPGWGLYMTRTEDGLWGWWTHPEDSLFRYVCEFGERQTPSTTTITTIETTLTTVAVTATSTTVGQSETTSITTPTTGRTSVSTPTAITTLVTETTSPSGAEISSKSGSVYGFAILIWVIMTYNNFFWTVWKLAFHFVRHYSLPVHHYNICYVWFKYVEKIKLDNSVQSFNFLTIYFEFMVRWK